MNNLSENRICQNCHNEFIIKPEDFSFYEKIKVPPPTFCPGCSHQRRFAWRNTHALYHRPDSVTGKDLISIYHPDIKMNVVDQKYWWSDAWDAFDYGRDYDFSQPFFIQWKELRDKIPFQSLSNSKAVNSDYCNVAEESRDSYLCSASWKIERTMYSDSIFETKDCMDLCVVHKSELCYEDVYCSESYKLFYSEKSNSCTDSYFLYDCHGCVDCFMSSNLRNKSYCFENMQYSKEEYFEKLKQYNLGSFKTIQELKKQFEDLKIKTIHKYANIVNSNNSTGDNIDHADNCRSCFDIRDGAKDSAHTFWGAKGINDCYYCGPGIGWGDTLYESFDGGAGGGQFVATSVVYYSTEVEYSFNCYSCKSCFGCIGLRSKSYCILNKQYSKEEYLELLPKIKQHMLDMPYIDKKGRVYKYGEFFPVELSPFVYNETIANDFYPLSKEEIIEKGYNYREKEDKKYTPTMTTQQLPDDIKDISDTITDDIIDCDTLPGSDLCPKVFKIIPDELSFYRRFNIPIPRRCYLCRHKARFNKRTPLKLWHRTCMCDKTSHTHEGKCEVEFETSYAPDRPEIIYCEKCYQNEVI